MLVAMRCGIRARALLFLCWCWCWCRCGVRSICGFTGDFYGFAHGWMASQGTQFGCAPQVALAAAGIREHDRAWVRVTAHASCGRLSAAFGGCLEASGGPPRRGGDPCVGLFGGGPRLFGFLSRCCLRRAACWRCCLWSPGSGSLAASSPYGTSPVWRNQAASLLLWSSLVRLDTAKPGRLAAPADAARDPEPTPRMVRSDSANDIARQAGPLPSVPKALQGRLRMHSFHWRVNAGTKDQR